ncbi:TonB-dependent outer membrane receptor protein [Psychroflexus torquis ATCC 700755]|uniref:TonB-dependent outer membrane receptor protein n=1 Tax=Psychroflexus torquis (strain ATCC 700755 / CIP 106069 / ACAM 623) TaxID=313595 RepID=K4I912_PSYTT|nr:TonB-dependent receptor [Psychroflexus torquis]AFU67102.1 TonB-dependent outer membrane receptor protein [Psychroflexus torquis ATCC 700755]
MKKNYVLRLMVMFLFSFSFFAQEVEIKGVITDQDNQPLPGVTVVVEGTNRGATTDFDGNYTIKVEKGETLLFSYIGFDPQKIKIENNTTINVTLKMGMQLDSVVVIGSRSPGRTTVNSAVAIDVFDIQQLTKASPQVNLNQILNYVAPSFTSNTQTISDGTDHVDPASLRGLGPDQVLVLINGKRRHTSSLINVNGTFGRGSVGTDLNAIPAAAVQNIEVLRDGAAAQYGSDAIAGVINIILTDKTNELQLNVTSGANFSRNANSQTGGVDGETTNVSASYGLDLGDKGGFINFSGDFDIREDYNRMKEWEGDVYNRYNTVERFANADGYDITNLLDNDVSDVIQYGNQAGFNLDPNATKEQLQDILSVDNTSAELEARNQVRSDFNMRVGQSRLRGGRLFVNFALPLDDDGTELYSFAGISSRNGNSAGFYRLPNQSRTFTPTYINGFLPEINSKVKDESLSVGIKGSVGDWNVDFSNTYGKNSFLYVIGNTSNASLQNASPTVFDAGGFSFAQNTTNLDVSQFFEDVSKGLNVAFGGEHRLETYEIVAGQESSYSQYTSAGEVITLASQQPATDFFGAARPGGAQVFPGFSPKNELNRSRSSVAGYVDVELDVSEEFLLSFASRYEDYSDFGSTVNFKLASRYKLTDNVNLRASANTGFRAPSLHQLNFNSTSTIFDQNGDPQEVGTFANDSRAAELLGIPELKQEISRSISLGLTGKFPEANLTFTADAYWVGIDDRVVYTGQFTGPGTGTELDNLLRQANASRASFFANAIDTESRGFDFVITHKTNIGTNSKLNTDLSGTLSQTRQVGDIKASEVLTNAGLVDTYFPQDSRVYLEEAVPRTKINLTNNYTVGNFNVFLRNVFFGKVTEATPTIENQQIFSEKLVTDLSFGYVASPSLTFTLGANNIFDIYPDRAEDAFGNRSGGRFDWSRRAQQFGIAGRFLFARMSITLQ